MKIPMYQVDAFTERVFGGNPAAICILEAWLSDEVMQGIAEENNLSETAFLVERHDGYDLRWFTPKAEIDLAGHPTLASAFVVFEFLQPGSTEVRFESRSGPLTVVREERRLAMDFPTMPAIPCEPPEDLVLGLGVEPLEVLRARDHMAVLPSERAVRDVSPRTDLLLGLDSMGVIITAKGDEADFVSRFFAPKMGIPEDPVTGSAHCTLVPYWAEKLGQKILYARQVSLRGGDLYCEDRGERVRIAGNAVLYLKGEITL